MFQIYFPKDFKFEPLRHGLVTSSKLLHMYYYMRYYGMVKKQPRWEVHFIHGLKTHISEQLLTILKNSL
jgi:hypothetical protein